MYGHMNVKSIIPTFKSQDIQGDLDFSTLEDGTHCLFRNVGKELSLYAT
jgi:hypothetical protein